MMSDDAEFDEEIERQLEAHVHERHYFEQILLDDKELDVANTERSFILILTEIYYLF